MGFQVAFEGENVFTQSNVSRWRVSGGWSSNSKSATGQLGAHARNDQKWNIGRAESPRWCMGPYRLAEIRWSRCGLHLVSQKSHFIVDLRHVP